MAMVLAEIGSMLYAVFSSAEVSATANAIGTVGTGVSAVTEFAQEKINQNKEEKERLMLEQLTADFDFSKVPAEYQEAVIRHCEQFKTTSSSGKLFRDEDLAAFYHTFYSQNPSAQTDKESINKKLANFISSYDYYLRKVMSSGEKTIFHQNQIYQKENREQFESIKALIKTPVSPVPKSSVFNANDMYADAFGKILFLHDETNPDHVNVTLAKLYVKQRYMEGTGEYHDLPSRLARFVQEEKERFLLIEGDAGSGKTTLVEWLNYHYRQNEPEATSILGNRSLVTIRLRDLDKELISKANGLITAIRDYMRLPDDLALAKQFRKVVFILDGFDELCMIDKITNYTQLIENFEKKLKRNLPAKIIITSRPKYVRELKIPHKAITLLHFDKKQRDEWLTNYKTECKQNVAPHIEEYIQNIDEDGESTVFDTPMALYMIAARNPDESALENSWRLYHTIFYEDIRDTEYNQMIENPENPFTDDTHPASEQWDIYYQISEEIAYRMYKTQNSKLYVDSDDLREIINDLCQTYPKLKDQTTQEITKNCHVLCCYWKTGTENGVLEFYHNNIRDFFLCEKIYREVNKLYQSKTWDSQLTVLRFVELFQYDYLELQVCQFIRQRSECCKDKEIIFCRNDFPLTEYRLHHLPDFFQLMVTNGRLFLHTETPDRLFEGVRSANPVRSMLNVLNCVINLFDLAYLPHLKKKETFCFWQDINSVNENALLQHLLCVPKMWLYLHSADLTRANLIGADLIGAYLTEAHLTGADLTEADLTGAILTKADLTEADLTEAKLNRATLPDGFSSDDQDEQIEHLKSLNIEGLKI